MTTNVHSGLEALRARVRSELTVRVGEHVARLDLPMVQDHLDRSRLEPSLLLDRYVCLASGGSSGTRGVFVQTVGAYAEFVASLMRRPMARMMASGGDRLPRVSSSGSSRLLRRSIPPVSAPGPAADPCASFRLRPRCRSPRSSNGSTPCSRRCSWAIRRSWLSLQPNSTPAGCESRRSRSPRPARCSPRRTEPRSPPIRFARHQPVRLD